MIVDTHCHLELNDVDKIKKMNDNIMIVSGADPVMNKDILNFKNDNIYLTLGLHPDCAETYTDEDIALLENNINNPKVVGIGEIGLDYYYTKENKDKQKNLFILQLELARKYNKPVVIHSRDSIQDTYEILEKYKDLKKDIHCFSSSPEMAKRFIEINSYIGIGGVVTFKNGKSMQDVVQNINIDRILLETDSPYLAPEPLRGTENEPYNTFIIAKKIAEIKNMDVDDVINRTTNNACCLFDLHI